LFLDKTKFIFISSRQNTFKKVKALGYKGLQPIFFMISN